MVTRWDPFSEALSLRDAMGRLFEQNVLWPGDASRGAGAATFAPAMDVSESADGYTVRASLPGVKPDDVNIEYQRGVLTLSGETYEEHARDEGTYHVRERRQGRFSRTISLPDVVDASKAHASFEHGVLELLLPKAEETKPRRISIQATEAKPELGETASANGNHAPVGASA